MEPRCPSTGGRATWFGNNVAPNGTWSRPTNRADYTTVAVSEARSAGIKRYSAARSLPVTTRPQEGSDVLEQGILTFIDNSVDTTTGTWTPPLEPSSSKVLFK